MTLIRSIYIKVIIVIITVYTFVACRKDTAVVYTDPNSNCYCCEEINAPDQIVMGELTNMNYIVTDTLLPYDYNFGFSSSYKIDIDNDGADDFEIVQEVVGSYTNGPHSYTWIHSLNDSSFVSIDLQTDTSYFFITEDYYGSNPVYMKTTYHLSCLASSANDSVYSIANSLHYYSKDQGISLGQNWSKEKQYLFRSPFTIMVGSGIEVNDTIKQGKTLYKHDCKNLPLSEPVYIGIKKTYCGEEKLGWIKMTYDGLLLISEFAIQK